MTARTITIPKALFDQMRVALVIADDVLQKERFTGLDQNPKGVRDLVGSAAIAADHAQIKFF